MTFPAYEEVELPLLKLLYEHGGEMREMQAKATYAPLAVYFGLSETEINITRDQEFGDGKNEPVWNNRVQWARRKLKERGYLEDSRRGYWRLSSIGAEKAAAIATGDFHHTVYPDEISGDMTEGGRRQVSVNAYERNPAARQKCIDHYGYSCTVCNFSFLEHYGERGRNFIHVHHIVPISSIGESYIVNPITDLRPICPNCHSIIHRTDPPCSVDELRKILVV